MRRASEIDKFLSGKPDLAADVAGWMIDARLTIDDVFERLSNAGCKTSRTRVGTFRQQFDPASVKPTAAVRVRLLELIAMLDGRQVRALLARLEPRASATVTNFLVETPDAASADGARAQGARAPLAR